MNTLFSENGKIIIPPSDIIIERHGNNIVLIRIYDAGNGFLWGADCRIDKIIRSKNPRQDDLLIKSVLEVKIAAKKEIAKWVKESRKANRAFQEFTIIKYTQLELF